MYFESKEYFDSRTIKSVTLPQSLHPDICQKMSEAHLGLGWDRIARMEPVELMFLRPEIGKHFKYIIELTFVKLTLN